MQACGISLARLLRPVGVISRARLPARRSTCWAVVVPDSNQTFREIAFNVVAQRAEDEVQPRVFFDDFPDLMLYVRDVPAAGGGWNGVFMSDTRTRPRRRSTSRATAASPSTRRSRTVELVLEDGVAAHRQHRAASTRSSSSTACVLSLDPQTVFPTAAPEARSNEMTIAELRAAVAESEKQGQSSHNELITIHRKLSIPVACLVFGLIGLALGATNRRDGALGSFVLGLVVIFAYYIPLYLGPSLAKGEPGAAVARGLAAEHRHGAGRHPPVRAGATRPPTSRCASRCRRSCAPAAVRPRRRRSWGPVPHPRPLRGHVVRARARRSRPWRWPGSSTSPRSSTSPTRCSRAMRRGA